MAYVVLLANCSNGEFVVIPFANVPSGGAGSVNISNRTPFDLTDDEQEPLEGAHISKRWLE